MSKRIKWIKEIDLSNPSDHLIVDCAGWWYGKSSYLFTKESMCNRDIDVHLTFYRARGFSVEQATVLWSHVSSVGLILCSVLYGREFHTLKPLQTSP